MRRKLFQTLLVGVGFLSTAAVVAQTGDALRIPAGFEHWNLVNSMITDEVLRPWISGQVLFIGMGVVNEQRTNRTDEL